MCSRVLCTSMTDETEFQRRASVTSQWQSIEGSANVVLGLVGLCGATRTFQSQIRWSRILLRLHQLDSSYMHSRADDTARETTCQVQTQLKHLPEAAAHRSIVFLRRGL